MDTNKNYLLSGLKVFFVLVFFSPLILTLGVPILGLFLGETYGRFLEGSYAANFVMGMAYSGLGLPFTVVSVVLSVVALRQKTVKDLLVAVLTMVLVLVVVGFIFVSIAKTF